jgi:DNA-binding XRE family transcriptional regulator
MTDALNQFLGLSKNLLGPSRDNRIPLEISLSRVRHELNRLSARAAGRDLTPDWSEFPRCRRLRSLRTSTRSLDPRKDNRVPPAHLSQSELGIACGLSGSFISKFESGNQKPWRGAQEAIAAFFDLPIHEVFPEYTEATDHDQLA